MPDQMHVVAPWSDYKPQSFRTADYAAFYRKVADGLKQSIGRSLTTSIIRTPKNIATYVVGGRHAI